MSIEQRLEQVERQMKRLRIAVVVLAAALCGVVSMAAKDGVDGVDGHFDTVIANRVFVKNAEGGMAIALSSDSKGAGSVSTRGASGISLIRLTSTDSGGSIDVYNKTGETIVTLEADEFGNGEVGAWNRKGKGRVWDSQ